MDKIKQLMVKCGLKPELAAQICEAVESYNQSRDEAREAEYTAKLEEAKRVCVEETEAHKRELARRLQIFCEAKGATIEQSIARQTAVKEAAALAKLRDIQAMLEGVEPNGEPNGNQAEVQRLQRRLQSVSEEKNQAIAAMNRTNAIAQKVLKKNRLLESKLAAGQPARQVLEHKAQQPKRLDHERRGGAPQTTRPTLLENQDRRPPQPKAAVAGAPGFTPEGIAQVMEADLI